MRESDLDLRVPHVDEYFGPWAIEESRFAAAVDRFRQIHLPTHLELHARDGEARGVYRGDGYEVRDGVAIIDISGPMMKYTSSLSGGTSTIRARREIANAAANPDARAILLRIDSPGGTVSGTADLASEVRRAAASKPIHALIEDLGASAAYWVATQAGKVWAANATTMVGSIGTYAVLYDYSGAAAMEGVKVHVVRAGAFKGAAVDGTEITPEQLGEFQRIVNEINAHFLAGVSAGRKLSAEAVGALADGRVHLAEPAVGLRLIDGIQTLDEALSHFRGKAPRSARAMSETHDADAAPRAATYQEILAACPKANSDFICQQLAAGATVETVRSAYTAKLEADLTVAREETAAKAKEAEAAKAKAAPASKLGASPLIERALGSADSGAEDPVSAFEQAVAAKIASGWDRHRAIADLATRQPELHQGYLLATNPGGRAQRLITDKFGG